MYKPSWQVRAEEFKLQLGGKSRKLKHYRCGGCRARKSMHRELWNYVQPPKCKMCGVRDWRLDNSRTKEHTERKGVFNSCHCDGAWYPHRKGSIDLCIFSHQPPES